jgi:hypothetical protein
MRSKYNASYFLNKLEYIPDSDWTTGAFNCNGKSCALGHLGAPVHNYIEVAALTGLFRKYINASVTSVNDGKDARFEQITTPRLRVISALKIIKALRKR